MERPAQQPNTARDMVFCHECENEWYRDEHGLTCPDCQSDFTEIIELQHDPREELHLEEEDEEPMRHLQTLQNHNPWHHHDDNAPDPDEDDISNIQWESNGPRSMSFQFVRNFPAAANQHDPQHDPRAGNPLMQSFATMLNGIVGGRPAHNDLQPQTTPNTHTFQGGGPGFMWSATARIVTPRDANNPQPQAQPFDDLPNYLHQMFPPPGGARGAQPGGNAGDAFANMGPLGGLFAGLFNPANMQHGDAVYSQEALDRIISQLMEQNASGNAPGPASAEAIANLPQKTISEKDLDDQGKADCSICMDSAHVGENVTLLPCNHWFHGECIKAWLGEHDTCPHCRQGIMPRDAPADASAPRNPDQQPRHDQNWTSSHAAPSSPTQHRSSSSGGSGSGSAASGGGGLFGRMRDAFGGGAGSQR